MMEKEGIASNSFYETSVNADTKTKDYKKNKNQYQFTNIYVAIVNKILANQFQ